MTLVMRSILGVTLGALLFLGRTGEAQTLAAGRASATRSELERLAVGAEESAIRERLREGDFRAGDRIVLSIRGDSAFNDTVVVRPGITVSVLSLPDDTLRGVLRSELHTHLTAWITRFYKHATVEATPLVQFGVLGEVMKPGYYRLPIDLPLSDAIMTAGGPTARADMPKTVVRRRSQEVLSKTVVRDAIAGGLTLDQLGLNAGDELVVAGKTERRWQTFVQIGGFATGILLAVRAFQGP